MRLFLIAMLFQTIFGGRVHVPPDGPTGLPIAASITAIDAVVQHSGTIVNPPADADRWLTVDLASIGVPADALAVHLSGRLQITFGSAWETEVCDMHLFLRRPGTPDEALASTTYIGQAVLSGKSGVRSGVGAWVALDAGRFELKWTRTTPPPWPAHCSYSVRLFADAWTRPE